MHKKLIISLITAFMLLSQAVPVTAEDVEQPDQVTEVSESSDSKEETEPEEIHVEEETAETEAETSPADEEISLPVQETEQQEPAEDNVSETPEEEHQENQEVITDEESAEIIEEDPEEVSIELPEEAELEASQEEILMDTESDVAKETYLKIRTDERITVNAVAVPADPTQYFLGWATETGGAVVYPAYQKFTVETDTDLYPVFSEENPTGTIDINIRLNGSYKGSAKDVAKFDIFLEDGTQVKTDAVDFYKKYPAGTKFIISNIRAEEGYKFVGLSSANSYGRCVKTAYLDDEGNIRGTIAADGITDAALAFISDDYTGTAGNVAKMPSIEINAALSEGDCRTYNVPSRENQNQFIREEDWMMEETDTETVYTAAWSEMHYLDLNAKINGRFRGNSSGYAKFDVYINGELSAHNITDYYKRWPEGTRYRVVASEIEDGYSLEGAFDGVSNSSAYAYGGGLEGTVQDARTEVLALINTESVKLTLDANDGTGTLEERTVPKNTEYKISGYKCKRPGYAFAGWSYTPDGSADIQNAAAVTLAEDTTLYAVWLKENYVDINGMVNGTYKGSLRDYMTFDVYADDVKVAEDISDFYRKYTVGTNIRIDDLKPNDAYVFAGTSERKSYRGVFHQTELSFEVGGESVNDIILMLEDAPDPTLVADFKVVDGVVKEVISGKEIPSAAVCDVGVHFTGDGSTGISIGKAYYDLTIEAIVDFDESSMNQSKTVYSTYDGTNGKINSFTLVKNSNTSFGIKANRLAVDPYQSNLITVNSTVVNKEKGTNEYENLTTGDTFVALSGDVTNKITIGQVNGAQSVNELKSVKWYYRTAYGTIYLNNTHMIKELRFYSTPRTAEQMMEDYAETGVADTVTSTITGADGIVGLGSPTAWHFDENGKVVWDDSVLVSTPGIYSGITADGSEKKYAIAEFDPQPAAVDNSAYQSIHITNKLSDIYLGKQYSLTAYPYPYNGTGNYLVEWSSSDNSIVRVVDGLVFAKSTGRAVITARLAGTDISDSFEMNVIAAPYIADNLYTVPEGYVSAGGHVLNSEDRQESMRAVYDAIDEAHANGYTHILFPFAVYASAIEKDLPVWYVPSNMTIEFNELHMVYQDYMANNHQLHTFEFGVPGDDYTNRCENSKLIVHQYYGERYDEFAANGSVTEGSYIEELRFAEFGRKAYNCSIQIENAQYPAGYFITVDGTGRVDKTNGVITYGNLVSGRLSDNGSITADANWISTPNAITVPESVKTDGYFISNNGQSSYAAKYQRGCTARLMDILWYDAGMNLISVERFLGTIEYYKAPANAAYFKVSLQQSELPLPGSKETADSPWLAMHDDGSAKFCEIKNTNVFHSATGMFSVVGETDGLWIHDNYVPEDGTKPGDERTGDLENGWSAMRHTVISRNVMDSSSFTAFASGGIGTVLHIL